MRSFCQRVMHRHVGAKLEENKGILALVLFCALIVWLGKTCKRFWRTSTTWGCSATTSSRSSAPRRWTS